MHIVNALNSGHIRFNGCLQTQLIFIYLQAQELNSSKEISLFGIDRKNQWSIYQGQESFSSCVASLF